MKGNQICWFMNVDNKWFIINHILRSGDYDFNAENFMQNDNNKKNFSTGAGRKKQLLNRE